MILLEKWMMLTPLNFFLRMEGDFGKLIVAKGFENLSEVQ